MLVFSDFQCPFCGRFARETWPKLQSDYVSSGLVYVAFRHFPLASHERAKPLAEAVQCGEEQGTFWALHDGVFGDQLHVDDTSLDSLASKLRMNLPRWHACREQAQARSHVELDIKAGEQFEVRGTPWFLVGKLLPNEELLVTAVVTGVRPFDAFQRAFETAGTR